MSTYLSYTWAPSLLSSHNPSKLFLNPFSSDNRLGLYFVLNIWGLFRLALEKPEHPSRSSPESELEDPKNETRNNNFKRAFNTLAQNTFNDTKSQSSRVWLDVNRIKRVQYYGEQEVHPRLPKWEVIFVLEIDFQVACKSPNPTGQVEVGELLTLSN